MHRAAESLNDWVRQWIAVSDGVLLGAIAFALAAGELPHLMRRSGSGDEACRAFAHAVSRGDLEAAEDMATLAFAGMSVVETPNESTGCAGSASGPRVWSR